MNALLIQLLLKDDLVTAEAMVSPYFNGVSRGMYCYVAQSHCLTTGERFLMEVTVSRNELHQAAETFCDRLCDVPGEKLEPTIVCIT